MDSQDKSQPKSAQAGKKKSEIYLSRVLSEINKEFIDPKSNKRSLFNKMLTNALKATGSGYGFIGEVFLRNGSPMLKTYAITDISWDEETSRLYKRFEAQGMEFTNLNTLFGYTLRTGKTVISNDPSADTRRGGLPRGHPALNHYLGLPIKDKENVLIGMLGLANKKGGYNKADEKFLEPLISLAALFISAIKANEARNFFSDSLDAYKKAIDNHAIVSVTDVDGVITFVNDRFCEISKYSRSEIIGKKHSIVNSGFHSKAFFSNLWNTIVSGNIWKGEIRNKAKDGSYYWIDSTIVPFLDENGLPYQFVSIRTDITKIKKQDQEILNFFNLSVDFLCIISQAGNFIKISPSFITALGFSPEELYAMKIADLIHPEDIEPTLKEIEHLSSGSLTTEFVDRYRKKDGSYMLLSWKGSINKDDGLIYGTATDITKKVELEENLLQSRIDAEKAKAKDSFLANMSHEIRTPLNAVMGFTDLLRNTKLDTEQNKHLEIITAALKNLNIIINDILDLSKIESGKLELEKRPFKIENTLRQVIQMHSARANSRGIKLILQFDSAIPEYVVGDETRLSQILINLLSNAIKFTPQGKIVLSASETNRTNGSTGILFSVKDTGIGIEPSKINLIFDRFTQAEDYTTRIYGGTGLGLNIVKLLVEMHEGKLNVSSKLGTGSEFTFELTYPVANDHDKKSLQQTKAGKIDMRLDGVEVLLFEDNEHNQILAKVYLEKYGASISTAVNGSIGIELLRKNKFSVILMDVQMPVMDGIEATRIIRKDLKLNLPIIGCSAHAMASEKTRCIEAGMNDYITKPYSENELLSAFARQHIGAESLKTAVIVTKPPLNENISAVFKEWEENYGRDTMELLLSKLQGRIPENISDFEAFLKTGALNKIQSLAHNLSGSLGGLNLILGHSITKKLEEAAKSNDQHAVSQLTAELIAYLQNFMEELKNI
jgi:PAS domain S-box-containing protein